MIEQSPLKTKPYMKERHIEVTQNYLMELAYDSTKGLTIKIVSPELIELEQVLSLEISDDIMNSSLRGYFLDVERVFSFMKDKNNIQIDIKQKTILLKAYKMIGSTIVDESVKLKLSKNQLKTDKIIIQMHKIQNKKMEVKLAQMKELYQNNTKTTNEQFSKLNEQLNKIVQKSAERQKKTNNKIKIIVILIIAMTIFLFCHKDESIVIKQIVDPIYEQKINKLVVKVEEIQKIISDYEKYKSKFNQLQVQIAKKVANKESLNIDVVKKQITDKSNQLSNNIDQRLLKIFNKVQVSIKQIKDLTKQIVDEKITQLKNQLKDKLSQTTSGQVKDSLSEHIDRKQLDKSVKKINNIQAKIQDLQKIIKRTSIFDLTSTFADSFNIQAKTITNLAPSGRWTQILLRDTIPFQKAIVYKFKILHSTNNAIILGVVDSFRIKHRSSLPHNNTLAYSGRGQLWKNGVMDIEKTGGFQEGDLIQMHVQLWKGKIEWSVNGKVIQSASSQKLSDNTIAFRPYLEMAHMKDTVEVLQAI